MAIIAALLTGYWPGEHPVGPLPAPRHRLLRQVRVGVPGSLDAVVRRILMPLPREPRIGTPGELAQVLRLGSWNTGLTARPLGRVVRAVKGWSCGVGARTPLRLLST